MRTPPLSCLAAIAFAASGFADTVVLKDGRIITGRVVERGDRIYVEQERVGTSFLRSEVARVETDEGAEVQQETMDVVLLKDGRIVRGEVSVAPDGRDVIVKRGERGEVRHPRNAVQIIRWRDGRQDAPGLAPGEAGSDLQRTVDRLVKDLDSPIAAIQNEARRELLALGPFARSYLDALKVKHPVTLGPLIGQLDRIEALRRVLPGKVEEAIPRLAERLVSPDEDQRESALKAVVVEAPAEVGPLLLHVVERESRDPNGSQRIKAYCVSQLAALRSFEELGQVLKLTEGPLRLAAALALGDAGIYAGVPIVIEALRIQGKGTADREAQQIREVANTKLCEWTQQQFGFRAGSPPEEREVAVRRWETWWKENGDEFLRRGLRESAPELAGSKVTEDEKSQALKRWEQATRLMASALEQKAPEAETPEEEAERLSRRRQLLEQAVEELGRALERDPGLSTARLTRATLLYEELGRPRDAERELDRILARAEFDQGDPAAAKKFAHYHLAQIALSERAWQRAVVRFSQALNYDEQFTAAHEGQGDAHLALAMEPGEGQGGEEEVEARRDSLEAARRSYAAAIESVVKQEDDLRRILREMMSEAPDSVGEGQMIQMIRRNSRNLEQIRARLQAKLGRVWAALGHDRKALEAFQVAVALDGENEEYKRLFEAWGKLVGEVPDTSPPPAKPPAPLDGGPGGAAGQ